MDKPNPLKTLFLLRDMDKLIKINLNSRLSVIEIINKVSNESN